MKNNIAIFTLVTLGLSAFGVLKGISAFIVPFLICLSILFVLAVIYIFRTEEFDIEGDIKELKFKDKSYLSTYNTVYMIPCPIVELTTDKGEETFELNNNELFKKFHELKEQLKTHVIVRCKKLLFTGEIEVEKILSYR